MNPALQIGIKACTIGLALAFVGILLHALIQGNCSGGDVLVLGALAVGACTVSGIVVSG